MRNEISELYTFKEIWWKVQKRISKHAKEHCVEKQKKGSIFYRGTNDVHKMSGFGWAYKMGILFKLWGKKQVTIRCPAQFNWFRQITKKKGMFMDFCFLQLVLDRSFSQFWSPPRHPSPQSPPLLWHQRPQLTARPPREISFISTAGALVVVTV